MRHRQAEPSDLIRSVSRALRVLESVGKHPCGLTVKQIARRCGLTTATTYHLVRTLTYEGYLTRREDGTYVLGLEVSDRFRELTVALRGPTCVGEVLRRASALTGYSHFLGSFVAGRATVTATAEGPRSPHLEDAVVGFDEAAHATALGKALLATLTHDQRLRYLKDAGMRPHTSATITEPEALEADLRAGERRGVQIEIGQFRVGVGCVALTVVNAPDPERRIVLACALPADQVMESVASVRAHLLDTARALTSALGTLASEDGVPA